MLHEFLISNREEILARSRKKLGGRRIPTPTPAELADGLPLFLDQLVAILRAEKNDRDAGHGNVSASAALHGGQLLRMGLTVGQVVHDYGSICQSVTELADERDVAITADEFQTFNRCLDDAIAQAVTAYEGERDLSAAGSGVAHLGFLAHEMRNLLATSMLTYRALERGSVGMQGSTGALLGRSLRRMRVLIDVQDECGGLPPGKAEELFKPFEQRGADRTGLGLGLSISLKGVRASGGEIRVRDLPGSGCMFTVDLPRAAPVS